jgi:hypothetical protein
MVFAIHMEFRKKRVSPSSPASSAVASSASATVWSRLDRSISVISFKVFDVPGMKISSRAGAARRQ